MNEETIRKIAFKAICDAISGDDYDALGEMYENVKDGWPPMFGDKIVSAFLRKIIKLEISSAPTSNELLVEWFEEVAPKSAILIYDLIRDRLVAPKYDRYRFRIRSARSRARKALGLSKTARNTILESDL